MFRDIQIPCFRYTVVLFKHFAAVAVAVADKNSFLSIDD